MTTIHIVCPGCGAALKTEANPTRKKSLRCPRCSARFSTGIPVAPRSLPKSTATLAAALTFCAAAGWATWDLVRSGRQTKPLVTSPAYSDSRIAQPVAFVKPPPRMAVPERIDPDSPVAKAFRRALASLEKLTERPKPVDTSQLARGKELFMREWLPGDPRSHGDGLGPVFNDSSCVACHNLGGPGGGGPIGKNVDILTAATVRSPDAIAAAQSSCAPSRELDESVIEGDLARVSKFELNAALGELEELSKIHVGFRHTLSVVLHRFGTDNEYEFWRQSTLNSSGGTPGMMSMQSMGGSRMMNNATPRKQVAGSLDQRAREDQRVREAIQRLRTQAAEAPPKMGAVQLQSQRSSGSTVLRSQRNTTALFGAGLIDAIPDAAIVAAAGSLDGEFVEVQGRPALRRDGSVGRFGWKGQTAHLDDFVLTACAVEVGLEVPDHHQGYVPHKPDYKVPGLDMNQKECDALIAYVRSLPAPVGQEPRSSPTYPVIAAGRTVFENVGCAACHRPDLGEVYGLYSDLLLHDMGSDLADVGQYGISQPQPTSPGDIAATKGATRQEWRTPPLWGLRDSGPYLHDGRAETIEQAIALHGGQAELSTTRYFSRTSRERQQLLAFLRSLAAPTSSEPVLVVDQEH